MWIVKLGRRKRMRKGEEDKRRGFVEEYWVRSMGRGVYLEE